MDVKNRSLQDEAPQTAAKNTGERVAAPASKKRIYARLVRWQRLAIQIVFLIFAPQVFSLAFAGVKELFSAVGKFDAIDVNSFLILLMLLIALTIVFGRFFCGYLCAFGTIGDILYKIVDYPLKRLGVKRPRIPRKVEDALRCLKYVVLLFFVGTSLAGIASIVNVYSPWTAFGRLLSLNIVELNVVGLVLLALIAVGMVLKERFFCEFLCPMGAVFSLLPVIPHSTHRRHMPSCDQCGACQRSCPVAVFLDADSPQMGECVSCGRCATVCHKSCIAQCSAEQLAQSLETGMEEPEGQKPMQRAHTVRSIVLAVVVLIVFWALGACDNLPAFPLG